jgi:hypothetical protein
MIRHCVFYKLRADVPQPEHDAIKAQLAALVGPVDGLVSAKFGPNVSPEGLDQGFSNGFVMDLRDATARDGYLIHPDHKAAGARFVAALEGGRDGLIVIDLEI